MADTKPSFVLYCDQIFFIEDMNDAQAGELFKIIYKYCGNGRIQPNIKDPVVKMAFKAIRLSLDRDYIKWVKTKKERSECGKLGGRPKKAKGF